MNTWESAKQQFIDQHGRSFVKCEDEAEREGLIQIILSVEPAFDFLTIELALGHACRNLIPPRNIDDVLKTIRENIGKV